LLIAAIICIIRRAVCFSFLSSLSKARCTWQKSHSTPSDAETNCIVGISSSAGMSLRTCTFLNTSPAVFGAVAGPAGAAADCASDVAAPAIRAAAATTVASRPEVVVVISIPPVSFMTFTDNSRAPVRFPAPRRYGAAPSRPW
jgi:CBS domain containing-hemolysin-like protein